jgi:hypothetical protein
MKTIRNAMLIFGLAANLYACGSAPQGDGEIVSTVTSTGRVAASAETRAATGIAYYEISTEGHWVVMAGLNDAGERIATARTSTDTTLHTVQYQLDQGKTHSEGLLSVEAKAEHRLRVYGTANGQSIDVLVSRDASGAVRIDPSAPLPSFDPSLAHWENVARLTSGPSGAISDLCDYGLRCLGNAKTFHDYVWAIGIIWDGCF